MVMIWLKHVKFITAPTRDLSFRVEAIWSYDEKLLNLTSSTEKIIVQQINWIIFLIYC